MTSLFRHPAALATGGLMSLAVALGIGRFVYTPILPYMVEGLEISKSEAGLIASANFLGYLLGALGAAKTALPGSRRAWFLSALVVSALSTGAMAATTSMSLFVVLRFAGGAASALVMVFSAALILDRLAQMGRPGLSALHFAGVGSGIAISAVIVAGFAASGDDWRGLWLISGGISVAALVPILWLVPRQTEKPPAAQDPASGDGGRRLKRLIVAYGLFGFGYVITATFISDMMRASPVLQPAEHLVWLFVGLSAVPSVALWTWVGRRWGNDRSFAIACLVEAAGVALSVLSEDISMLLLSAGLLGGTFMGLTALGLINARLLSAGDPRRSLALMTAAFGLGQMVGPALAGALYDLLGSFQHASLIAAAALVLAAALTMRLR